MTDTARRDSLDRETPRRIAAALALLFGPTLIVVAIIVAGALVAYFASPLDYLH